MGWNKITKHRELLTNYPTSVLKDNGVEYTITGLQDGESLVVTGSTITFSQRDHIQLHTDTTSSTGVIADVWVKASGSSILSHPTGQLSSSADNQIIYTGVPEFEALCMASITAKCDTASTVVKTAFAQTGSIISASIAQQTLKNANDSYAHTNMSIVHLSKNDTIEMWVTADKNCNVTFDRINIVSSKVS
jgi:hypothetical protein